MSDAEKQTYEDWQREDLSGQGRRQAGKYRAEDIALDIAHLHTDRNDPYDRGLIAKHEMHPASALHLMELLPALEGAYSVGDAGKGQRELVEHEAASVEHVPLRIPFSCNIKTRKVTKRFPTAAHRIEMAQQTPSVDPTDNHLGVARTDNGLVRIYRAVARQLNEQARPAPKPRQSHANRPWMVNQPCAVCGEPIYRDQPIWWVPGTNEVSCREHERLTA